VGTVVEEDGFREGVIGISEGPCLEFLIYSKKYTF
jgi:hypothetical protein